MTTTKQAATPIIDQIDVAIDALRDRCTPHIKNLESAASWQTFWDANPRLKEAENALYLARGIMQTIER